MLTEDEIREKARQWARSALKFDEPMASMIQNYIDTMPLTDVGAPFCPACENKLCGVCSRCHGLDVYPPMQECPVGDNEPGQACIAWWQAHKSVYQEVRADFEGDAW